MAKNKLSLLEQLALVLNEVLPEDPEQALNGPDLLQLVKPKLDQDVNDDTVRSYFSYLSGIITSPIAKREGKQGYYKRNHDADQTQEDTTSENEATPPETKTRDEQDEEIFRAIYIRLQELNRNSHARLIEHTRGSKTVAGRNRWKFPDVVTLHWDSTVLADDTRNLIQDMIEVRRASGDQIFTLESSELKVSISDSNLREYFFQCVSNSKWANKSTLAIAKPITDEALASEVRRLGSSYGIAVYTYGLSPATLAEIDSANTIMGMSAKDFYEFAESKTTLDVITSGSSRESIDWPHISDMRLQHNDFVAIFEWIASSLNDYKTRSFADWQMRQRL